ncbi:hypothetical protein J6590_054687 [Homalodisca vitripennis]|nr:hypothetical protein J6590_054687 [Homalodisca vitripennis]
MPSTPHKNLSQTYNSYNSFVEDRKLLYSLNFPYSTEKEAEKSQYYHCTHKIFCTAFGVTGYSGCGIGACSPVEIPWESLHAEGNGHYLTHTILEGRESFSVPFNTGRRRFSQTFILPKPCNTKREVTRSKNNRSQYIRSIDMADFNAKMPIPALIVQCSGYSGYRKIAESSKVKRDCCLGGLPLSDSVFGDGQEGAPGGSDSGAILNLVGPLIASSSQRGQEEEAEGAPGGSDSGAILGLLGPLISSSSGVGSGGEGGDAGSGSGSILNLIGPLLGSSSGSSGGVGGDGSSGGGSDLSSILGISNSSGGGSGGGTGHSGGSDAGIGGAVNLKFGIFTKILNSLSGALAAASSPQHVPIHELKYPDP